MHELSVCQSMLRQIQALADEHQAQQVARIVLQVGPLSGVDSRLLHHAFPIAVAGSIAERAQLEIEELPIKVACSQCQRISDALSNRLLCEHCGSWKVRLISGDELMLKRLEFETSSTHERL